MNQFKNIKIMKWIWNIKIILRILAKTHFNIMKQQNQKIKTKKELAKLRKQQELRQHNQWVWEKNIKKVGKLKTHV